MSAASFSVPAFFCPAFLSIALTASPQDQPARSWRPSEEHFHGGGLAARLSVKGDGQKTHKQSRKKKNMKTTSQKNNSGLGSRSAQSSSNKTNTAEAQTAPVAVEKKDNRLPIDTEARKKNRTLPTEKVLTLLQQQDRRLWELAEVVGKWVWVSFSESPAPTVRQTLAQLGFHWNRTRQAWQHPCGQFRLSSAGDPHEKYQSYQPAAVTTN